MIMMMKQKASKLKSEHPSTKRSHGDERFQKDTSGGVEGWGHSKETTISASMILGYYVEVYLQISTSRQM
jgi:hypothetical protein